jgi:hypothetical protein
MPRDEDDEDRPRRKRRREDEDADEDRPRRKRRREDDEDDDRAGSWDDEDEDDEDDYEPRRGRLPRETLRGIAGNQKAIILCILVYLCLIPVQFVIPEESRMLLLIALAPLGIVSTVFVFLLATKVYSQGTGIVLAILTLIPLVGLIVLLIINGKATNILKENGIRVGLLGASSSDL